jgi:hypothetical protein
MARPSEIAPDGIVLQDARRWPVSVRDAAHELAMSHHHDVSIWKEREEGISSIHPSFPSIPSRKMYRLFLKISYLNVPGILFYLLATVKFFSVLDRNFC